MMSIKKYSKRILHFCPDDKFIDSAVKQFETCAPGVHEYVIYNRESDKDVKYIRKLDRFTYAPVGSVRYREVLNNCSKGKYYAIIMHSLPSRPWELVKAMRGHGKVVVFTWGHEIYGFINDRDYMDKTDKILRTVHKKKIMLRMKERFLSLRLTISAITSLALDKNLKAFLMVDYISPVIDEDFNLFAKKFNKYRLPEILPFSYYLDVEVIKRLRIHAISNDYILVGNSATPTCNHLDVFDRLNQLGISNIIFAPLNYGDSEYGALVKQEGQRIFGDRFISLDIFLSFEEYLLRLNQCRYVVMGHLRQQAVGNIVLALWMGAKVFFYKSNPVYKFLTEHGACVFNLEEAASCCFSIGLDQESIKKNREVVESIWGWESALKKTRNVITAIYPNFNINKNI